ncbi:MAG: dTDP-4-dehydrorhamnose 3,5-epimerase family protein [Candidatus Ratteibacteria bacterium]|jgi:dTDP-4-dehydrorhamnose 3,5-epimerase
MTISSTFIPGVFLLSHPSHQDIRGTFTRLFCLETIATIDPDFTISQTSVSHNPRKATLRGMHYQKKPFEEKKAVSCVYGAAYDVVIDLRPHSPTFQQWTAVLLLSPEEEPHTMEPFFHAIPVASLILIPEGCAHGFLTLQEKTVMLYHISTPYHPKSAAGVRWNDPTFKIAWPETPRIISEKDASYKDFL